MCLHKHKLDKVSPLEMIFSKATLKMVYLHSVFHKTHCLKVVLEKIMIIMFIISQMSVAFSRLELGGNIVYVLQ